MLRNTFWETFDADADTNMLTNTSWEKFQTIEQAGAEQAWEEQGEAYQGRGDSKWKLKTYYIRDLRR